MTFPLLPCIRCLTNHRFFTADTDLCFKFILILSILSVFIGGVFLGVAIQNSYAVNSQPKETVTFLAVGDWGRQGEFNQTQVADLMDTVSAQVKPHFIVSTGDNFYPSGLNSSHDPSFKRSFTDVYSGAHLQHVPWHVVLGNHDYNEDLTYCGNDVPPCTKSVVHELSVNLTVRDSRWHCERSFVESLGFVDIFFIDTSPFIQNYTIQPWAKYSGGILNQSYEAQSREIETRLAASMAPWKIVIGHHPPYSNGEHGNAQELIDELIPILTRYKVDAYISGHDHSLEHLYKDDLHVFVSGGGSKSGLGFNGTESSLFQYPYSGFISVTVQQSYMEVNYHTLEEGTSPVYTAKLMKK